jgi:hypothetical protein
MGHAVIINKIKKKGPPHTAIRIKKKCSLLIFILVLSLQEGQAGDAWEPTIGNALSNI